MRTGTAFWIGSILVGLVVGVARGDHRHDCAGIERLAAGLQKHGRELDAEFRQVYRTTPQYGALRSNARDIVSRAGRLQELARRGAGHGELHSELDHITSSYRHMVQLVRAANATCFSDRSPVSWIRVPDRRPQVRHLLECVDNTIDQIDNELNKFHGSRNRPGWDPGPGGRNPNAPGPSGFTFGSPGNRGSTGLSIANGQLTFQFNR